MVRSGGPGTGLGITKLYLESVNKNHKTGEAGLWADVVEDPRLIQAVRRMKMGAIKGTKATLARGVKGWERVPEGKRETILECPCAMRLPNGQREDQDAYHVAMHCGYTEEMRERVVNAADEAVEKEGEMAEWEKWNDLKWEERLRYTLKTERILPKEVEKKVMSAAAKEWGAGMKKVQKRLESENGDFARATAQQVK